MLGSQARKGLGATASWAQTSPEQTGAEAEREAEGAAQEAEREAQEAAQETEREAREAKGQAQETATEAEQQAQGRQAQPAVQPSPGERKLIERLYQTSQMEVQAAEMAQKKAQSEDVKDFGEVFVISGEAPRRDRLEVSWDIADGYYLYINRFQAPDAHAEFDADPATALRKMVYAYDGATPDGRQSTGFMPEGVSLTASIADDAALPPWLSPEHFAEYVAAFSSGGFRGPLDWYRCIDLNWSLTAAFQGARRRLFTMPSP